MQKQKMFQIAIAQARSEWFGMKYTVEEAIRILKDRFNYQLQRGDLTALRKEYKRQIELRKQREERKFDFNSYCLAQRFARINKVLESYKKHADFIGNYYDRDKGDMREVVDYDLKRWMALIAVDGWVQYSRRYGCYRRMAGLVIRDKDTLEFRFLRVSPKCNTIDEALEDIKPAEVKKAEKQGKKVVRQGDFYFIPQKTWNLRKLEHTNHTAKIKVQGELGGIWIDPPTKLNGHTVGIFHPHHPPVVFQRPVKTLQQVIVANTRFGFGGGRISGHAD